MDKYKYIVVNKVLDKTLVLGFKSKKVMFEVVSGLLPCGGTPTLMDYSMYQYSDDYKELRDSNPEIIDYTTF